MGNLNQASKASTRDPVVASSLAELELQMKGRLESGTLHKVTSVQLSGTQYVLWDDNAFHRASNLDPFSKFLSALVRVFLNGGRTQASLITALQRTLLEHERADAGAAFAGNVEIKAGHDRPPPDSPKDATLYVVPDDSGPAPSPTDSFAQFQASPHVGGQADLHINSHVDISHSHAGAPAIEPSHQRDAQFAPPGWTLSEPVPVSDRVAAEVKSGPHIFSVAQAQFSHPQVTQAFRMPPHHGGAFVTAFECALGVQPAQRACASPDNRPILQPPAYRYEGVAYPSHYTPSQQNHVLSTADLNEAARNAVEAARRSMQERSDASLHQHAALQGAGQRSGNGAVRDRRQPAGGASTQPVVRGTARVAGAQVPHGWSAQPRHVTQLPAPAHPREIASRPAATTTARPVRATPIPEPTQPMVSLFENDDPFIQNYWLNGPKITAAQDTAPAAARPSLPRPTTREEAREVRRQYMNSGCPELVRFAEIIDKCDRGMTSDRAALFAMLDDAEEACEMGMIATGELINLAEDAKRVFAAGQRAT